MAITSDKFYFTAPFRFLVENLNLLEKYPINLEIFVKGADLDTYTENEINLIKKVMNKNKLKKILHGPWMNLSLGSDDPEIQRLTAQRLNQALEFCSRLGTKHMVIHSGFHPTYHRDVEEEWVATAIKNMSGVLKIAEDLKIVLSIENSLDNDEEYLMKIVDNFESNFLKTCFDAAHYNVFGRFSILEHLDRYSDNISEIHISDNDGKVDLHLPIGQGNIDFNAFFRKVKERNISPYITVESHSIEALLSDIELIKKVDW